MAYPSLKNQKIPFRIELTDKFVRELMRVAEIRPFLAEHLGTPLEVNLLRDAQIRAVTASNQIEGNSLKEHEVTAILNGRRVAAAPTEMAEVLNYHEALTYAENLARETRKFSQSDFRDLQKLVTKGLIEKGQWGRVRTIPVSIVNATTGKKIDECPEAHLLPGLMDDLWKWLDDSQGTNPFARAFAFHFIAVAIHPFADGNGRTVRLSQHLLLLKDDQDVARFVPSETAIMRHRSRYYSVIRQSLSLQSLHPFIEFMAECFAESAIEVAAQGKALLKSGSAGRDLRRKKILSFAIKSKEFRRSDLLSAFPEVPKRTLERDLEELVKEKKLKAVGEKKGRRYKPL